VERLEQDLVKSRDLARLSTDFPLRRQLRSLADQLRAARTPEQLAALESRLQDVTTKAYFQARLLQSYENARPGQRTFLRGLLEAQEEPAGALRRMLDGIRSRLPNVSFDAVVRALLVAQAAYLSARFAGEQDMVRAAVSLAAPLLFEALGTAGLGAAVVTGLVAEVLESARESGYQFAAGRQEAFDLREGIFTGLGRAGVSD
jgi:hypothetical protein